MKLEDITTGPLGSVADLIDLEERLLPPLPHAPNSPRWAFRGQPRPFGTLVPSFQRQFTRQSLGTAEIIERRLIDAFREHYDKLGDRSHDMPTPAQIRPGLDLRCLSVMQHYEIPTRLLDWSSDLWTSIYFACSTDPGESAELWYYDRRMFDHQRGQAPELQALMDPSQNPPNEPLILFTRAEQKLVELDPQISPRMKQQMGHHTVSTHVFADHAPLLHAMQTETFGADPAEPAEPAFRRVLIDAPCKSRALQFLAEHKNITASTIFPDVVGLGRFLRWQFESLRTMLL